MRTPRTTVLITSISVALMVLPAAPAAAAVAVDRLDHGSGQLQIEGTATANRDVTVDGVALTRSDDRGEYRLRVRGYTPPADCTIALSDDGGATSTEVTLPNCTTTAPPPPPPGEEPPPPGPALSGMLLSPQTVTGGATATGTVLLSGPAPAGGTTVTLSTDAPTVASVPATVTVGATDTAGSFTVTTATVPEPRTATLTATLDGAVRSVTLSVEPEGPSLSQISLSPSVVSGGTDSSATVTLTAPAPTGGVVVSLSSDAPSVASVPSSVTVPAGATTAAAAVTTAPTSVDRAATIRANVGASSATATLTVTTTPGSLAALTISPDVVVGGDTTTGTISLTSAALSDLVVTLASLDTSVATTPPSVTVVAGATTATFSIATSPVAAGTTAFAEIRATAGGVTRSRTLTTTPPPTGPALIAVTFAPSDLQGGEPATGTVTLDGPATDGARVLLTSSDPAIVTVPASVTVALGSTSAAFPVTTSAPSVTTTVTVAGEGCCGSTGTATGTLTVRPPTAPPQADVVRIDKAEWKPGGRGGTLEVRATSTNPNAILSVYHTASGGFFFTLTNQGGGRYEGEFARSGNDPQDITVRSNFGGSASAGTR